MSYVSDPDALRGPLASRAFDRLWLGFSFRPATLDSYQCMFKLFLAFLVVMDLCLHRISTIDILAFMEYLAESGMSPDNIVNHLTAIRSICIIYACDTTLFSNQRLPLFVKSLKINRKFQPRITFLVDDQLLLKIVTVSHHLPNSLVFTALYLFTFFSFLRLSNILSYAVNAFDSSRHLCVGYVIFSDAGATVIIQWSKTMQDQVSSTTIGDVATWAFSRGVPIEHIQVQGTWSSSCVWRYILVPPSASSQVASAFQHHLIA